MKRKSSNLSRLTVGVLVDREVVVSRKLPYLRAGQVERWVRDSLARQAKRVELQAYYGAEALLRWIRKLKPDVVFNLTEHAAGDRHGDSRICALLDLYRVPYTGAGPRGLMLCRDKAVSKLIAEREGFRVPRFFTVDAGDPDLPRDVAFPIVVKPRSSDSSDGISQRSLVKTRAALLRRIKVSGRVSRDVICEEFIAGREMVVGIACDRVMRAREFIVGRQGPRMPLIASTKFKHNDEYRKRWQISMQFAKLTRAQKDALETIALRTSRALEMGDYGRLDIKLAPTGEWAFLEANPNPALAPFRHTLSGSWFGVDFDELVSEITLRALSRARRDR